MSSRRSWSPVAVAAFLSLVSACGGAASKSPGGTVTGKGQQGVYFLVSLPKPTGGTIRSTDGQITCGSGGTACGPARYDWNGTATLSAQADAGYTFFGWAGDCGGQGSCAVNNTYFAADKTIAAVFTNGTSWSIAVVKVGTGGGAVSATVAGQPVGSCDASLSKCDIPVPIANPPAQVTLTALPDLSSHFGGWSGGLCSGKAPCTIEVDKAKSVVADFEPGPDPGGGGATAPVISSLLAAPGSITTGQSTVLSWTVSDATSVSIAPGVGSVQGSSVVVQPAASTTYTLTAVGAGGTATRTVSVDVQPPVGTSLTMPAEFLLTVQQGATGTGNVTISNPGTSTRYATVSVFNLHSDLGVSIVPSNPLSVLPGGTLSIDLALDARIATEGTYDDLLLQVSVDDGTSLVSNLRVTVDPVGAPAQPRLVIQSSDIWLLASVPGSSATIAASIRNVGNAPATNVVATFQDFGSNIGTVSLGTIPAGSTTTAVLTAPITTIGNHLITVVVTQGAGSLVAPALAELALESALLIPAGGSTQASRVIPLGSFPPLGEGILVMGTLPTQVCLNGGGVSLSGHATYDLVVNGARTDAYVVKGAPVTTRVTGPSTSVDLGTLHTNVLGDFVVGIPAPRVAGLYRVFTTVTDRTFTGTRELVFEAKACIGGEVPPPPPSPICQGPSCTCDPLVMDCSWKIDPTDPTEKVCPLDNPACSGPIPPCPGCSSLPTFTDLWFWSENIFFSNDRPAVGEEVTVFAELRYWSNKTSVKAMNVPVSIYATRPPHPYGAPEDRIGQIVVNDLSVGDPDYGSRWVFASWRVPAEGVYIIEFRVDDGYVEPYVLNNAATRAIIVGQYTGTLGAVLGHVNGPWGAISGSVVTVATPGGATIGSTVTDATGLYLIENVPPGDVKVTVSPPTPYGPSVASKAATVPTHAVTTVDFMVSAITLSPATATAATTGQVQFLAHGSYGAATWSIDPNRSGGSIDSRGLYTAGATTGVTDTVVYTDSLGTFASSTVDVVPASPLNPPKYKVTGTISGLEGTGLVLQFYSDTTGYTNLTVSPGQTSYSLPANVESGMTYRVSVATDPSSPPQYCRFPGGNWISQGTVANGAVQVPPLTCATRFFYPVTGTISGLEGTGLVLQLYSDTTGYTNLTVSPGQTSYSLPANVESGMTYRVSVATDPSSPPQYCRFPGGNWISQGTVANGAVQVPPLTCATRFFYPVTGTISGLEGTGLVLQLYSDTTGYTNLTVSPGQTSYSLPANVESGMTYRVSVVTNPSSPLQYCRFPGGTYYVQGTVSNGAVQVPQLTCATRYFYPVTGTISGLEGSGLVLQLYTDTTGYTNLTVSPGQTSYSLPANVESGRTYSVSVVTNPSSPLQYCRFPGGTYYVQGTVSNGAVQVPQLSCPPSAQGSWSGTWAWVDTPATKYTNVGLELVQNGASVSGTMFTGIANTLSGTVSGSTLTFTVTYAGRTDIDTCTATIAQVPTGNTLHADCIGYAGTPQARAYTVDATAHVCPSGRNACSLTCTPLQMDPSNCGVCGNACASGQVCNAGACVAGTGTDVSGTWNATETLTECGYSCTTGVGHVYAYTMTFIQDSSTTFHGTYFGFPVRGSTSGSSIWWGFDNYSTSAGPAQGQCTGTVSGNSMSYTCDEYMLSPTGLQLNGTGIGQATR